LERDAEGKKRGLIEIRGSEFSVRTEVNCTSLRTEGVPVRIGKCQKLKATCSVENHCAYLSSYVVVSLFKFTVRSLSWRD